MIDYRFKSKTFVVREVADPFAPMCTSPRIAVDVLRTLFTQLELDVNQEHMILLALNSKGKVIGHKLISSGTETGTLCSPAQILRAAIVLGGTSFVMCHNHPSGNPVPSREDITLTRRCKESGETLSLLLADHIILCNDSFHSFKINENWDNK
jgi:DNA repair protein RadC